MQKLFVLIRTDLNLSYGAVQAGHAVAEWMLQYGQGSEWQNGTLIYLGVKNEEMLKIWKDKIDMKGLQCAEFREPDIGNQITAIACLTDNGIFKKLKLLGE